MYPHNSLLVPLYFSLRSPFCQNQERHQQHHAGFLTEFRAIPDCLPLLQAATHLRVAQLLEKNWTKKHKSSAFLWDFNGFQPWELFIALFALLRGSTGDAKHRQATLCAKSCFTGPLDSSPMLSFTVAKVDWSTSDLNLPAGHWPLKSKVP